MGMFMPISPCNMIYKIIAKSLVETLKNVLDDIISQAHTTFFFKEIDY